MLKISKTFKLFLLAISLIVAVPTFAQLDPNSSTGGASGDPDTPIDGGLSILIAAGAAAGARKLHKNRKQKEQESKDI